jgi:hypothetical protein
MLSVIMMSAVMLSVVAPEDHLSGGHFGSPLALPYPQILYQAGSP